MTKGQSTVGSEIRTSQKRLEIDTGTNKESQVRKKERMYSAE